MSPLVKLTDEELVLLDGRCEASTQEEVNGAKERIAARSEYSVEPKQAGLIADVLREAREQGLLVYQHERIHYCSVCGWSGDYARYKSGPRRGKKNYDRPLMRPAVEFARRFIRFKNYVSVGACGECIEVILPHLKAALVGVECQLPPQLHTEGEPEYIRHGRRRCTECSWEGHEGEMGRLPAVFGGTYPGKCPSCGAESRPFGPRVFEIIDGFDVVERKS